MCTRSAPWGSGDVGLGAETGPDDPMCTQIRCGAGRSGVAGAPATLRPALPAG